MTVVERGPQATDALCEAALRTCEKVRIDWRTFTPACDICLRQRVIARPIGIRSGTPPALYFGGFGARAAAGSTRLAVFAAGGGCGECRRGCRASVSARPPHGAATGVPSGP
jgi:hypothetical protein